MKRGRVGIVLDILFSTFLKSLALVLGALALAIFTVDINTQRAAISSSSAPPASQAATLSISPLSTLSWQGFGASGAWWPGPLYRFSPSAKRELGRLLFSRAGLYLGQYRYNIGGGGVGVLVPWKAPPTFLQKNGTFDWSADPAGIQFLQMASKYHVHDLVGFVNSAPVKFTSNHKSCAGTLLPSMTYRYAVYLAKVVQGIREHLGVTLNYVSPMNEPDNSFPSCKQEGMAVPVGLRGQLVVDLGKALHQYAPWARVIADESSQVAPLLLPHLPLWANRPEVLHYLSVVSHHLYDFPSDATLSQMASEIAKFQKPSWMTEICCYNGAHFGYQYDPSMVSGLWLARTIYSDITFGRDSAFDWWTAVSPNLGCNPRAVPDCWNQVNYLGRNDGLAYYDINGASNGDQKFYLTKRYFVFGNFSKYIQPGAQVHTVLSDNSNIMALAAYRGKQWVVVVINQGNNYVMPTTLQMEFPTGTGSLTPTEAIQTSSSQDWSHVTVPQISGDTAVTSIPPHSVTTFLFRES